MRKAIGALAVEAMLYEVAATPKPGLVDRAGNGAHDDMDFFTFQSSAAALRGAFDAFAAIGRRGGGAPAAELLAPLQAAGIAAERQMFAMTGGVNTHKGMIFSLGLLAGAAGWAAARGEELAAASLCGIVHRMCKGLAAQEYASCAGKQARGEALTKGEAMYLRYGTAGARGEAESGFRTVREVSLPVYCTLRNEGMAVNDALVETLLHLVAASMDTNILGRHGMEALRYAQGAARGVLAKGGVRTAAGRAALAAMDAAFVRRWISPGGSADLLAATHFLYALEQEASHFPQREAERHERRALQWMQA